MGHMVSEERIQRIAVRVTPTEADMLRRLADEDGLSISDVLRQLVRREHANRYGKHKPKP